MGKSQYFKIEEVSENELVKVYYSSESEDFTLSVKRRQGSSASFTYLNMDGVKDVIEVLQKVLDQVES